MAKGLMRKVATIHPSDVREEEVAAVESALDHLAAETQDGCGPLTDFVVGVLESLKQGHEIALYAAEEV